MILCQACEGMPPLFVFLPLDVRTLAFSIFHPDLGDTRMVDYIEDGGTCLTCWSPDKLNTPTRRDL